MRAPQKKQKPPHERYRLVVGPARSGKREGEIKDIRRGFSLGLKLYGSKRRKADKSDRLTKERIGGAQSRKQARDSKNASS